MNFLVPSNKSWPLEKFLVIYGFSETKSEVPKIIWIQMWEKQEPQVGDEPFIAIASVSKIGW